ncbi:MAG: HEAT repeat domain-containing protein [Elusimicrobiota bacterium]|jgi:aminopeptidase N
MPRFLLVLIVVGGLLYFHQKYSQRPGPPPPSPPPAMDMPPPIALDEMELDKVRLATKDSDPQVRWAAIELLYRIKDPEALTLLEKTLAIDSEPQVRRNAVEILRNQSSKGAPKQLLPALRDPEKDIRIVALLAIGERGDASVIPDVSKLLLDIEPDVRLQALRTLARIQEKRVGEFLPLQEQLKTDYNEIVVRSKRKAQQEPSTGKKPEFRIE